MAGVAPAGSLDAGGDDIGGISLSITLRFVMLTLALDTSSAAGSAALVRDGAIAVERIGDPSRTHGERLPRELMTLLDDARVRLADVDMFAVAIGPGSFTGLRVGIATIQGLALAHNKRVVPISTFEALAAAGASPVAGTAVWIDAHRGEVFATLYAADGTVLQPPTSLPPAATLETWSDSLAQMAAVRFVGDGAVRYAAVVEAALGRTAGIPAGVPPLAGAVGRLAAREPGRAVRPHAVVPLYVRRADAEIARDRRRAGDGR
jgi:tRNA threonylcarbamoyladenosine biosynthesis protein TsaB